MKKIFSKIKKIRIPDFLVFHLLDIGKINSNFIFSIFNLYTRPQMAPWVLIGIGIESRKMKINVSFPKEKNYNENSVVSLVDLIITFFGKQKRIKLIEKEIKC